MYDCVTCTAVVQLRLPVGGSHTDDETYPRAVYSLARSESNASEHNRRRRVTECVMVT